MLVKFLSFAASFIGTGRYKPVLISMAIVLFSLGGVGFAKSWHSGTVGSVASKLLLQQDNNVDHTQQIHSKQKKTITDPTAPTAGGGSSQQSPSGTNSTQSATTIDVNQSSINLQAGQTGDPVSATIKGGGNWEWAVASEDTQALSATTDTTPTSLTLRVSAAGTATAGIYRVTIQAKNTVDHTTLSKVILVTVS